MVVLTCNSRTLKVWYHEEFKTSLGYMRSCLQKQTTPSKHLRLLAVAGSATGIGTVRYPSGPLRVRDAGKTMLHSLLVSSQIR